MEKFIVYDKDWQTPAKTEQYIYELLLTSKKSIKDVIYVAFPWANLIDGLERKTPLGEKLLIELEKLSIASQNSSSKRIVTVCQHIKFQNYYHLFKMIGITDLFASHKEKNQINLGAINLYPLQLYPVQSSKEARVNVSSTERNKSWFERQYPFSFVGAYDGRYYLTDSRANIFKHLSDKDGLVTERTSWHYQARVYDQQVYGKELSSEYLNEEQRNAIEYINVLLNSKFSLCPSGTGPNSIRLWESIEYGSIPIILADTLDLPGDPKLWEKACLLVSESKENISQIPNMINEVIRDKEAVNLKLEALNELKALFGLENFAGHVINTIEKLDKQQKRRRSVYINAADLTKYELEDWLCLISEIEIYLKVGVNINLVNCNYSVNANVNHISSLNFSFTQNFVVLFDSRTLSPSILDEFDNIYILPKSAPKKINHHLLQSISVDGTSQNLISWTPMCSIITSMFNGDEYKEGFLRNISCFDSLNEMEFFLFRPESRGKEHYDLINFGRNNRTLIYIWLAKDPGLYDIWNLGAKFAYSKFITNANIDDKRSPVHISKLVNILEDNSNVSVASTALRVTDTQDMDWDDSYNEIVWYKPTNSEIYDVDRITKINTNIGTVQAHNIPHCMPIWRAKLHRQNGHFEEERFGPSSDWEFWLRCGLQGAKFFLLNEDHGLYYRAPQSYWRRDPNATNYDKLIALEHFKGINRREVPVSRSCLSFNFQRCLKAFKDRNYYVATACLFKIIEKADSTFSSKQMMLLSKIAERYLRINIKNLLLAEQRLKPLREIRDTYLDFLGFYLRSCVALSDDMISCLNILADKIIINECQVTGWIVKAKIQGLAQNHNKEGYFLAVSYKINSYEFWCNVNKIYGLEKSLEFFLNALTNYTEVPQLTTFKWLTPGKKLYFFPDYSHGNPYQKLLYQNIDKAGVTAVGLSETDSVAMDLTIFEKGDVLHIHWINVLFKGHTKETILAVLDEFLDKVKHLKSNGVKIVWTVHNRQNHETIELDVELAFRRKLSGLCDAVLLHHPMIAIELSNWLDKESKIEIIEHGLYLSYYPNYTLKDEARSKLGIRDKCTVISTLGQVREYKYLPDKIDAISSVNKTISHDFKYIVAGKISCEKTLDKLKKIDMAIMENRFIRDDEVQVFLNACDFVLLSYRDILTSGSFFQSVTFNKPVLSPHLGSLNYYVCDGINGYKYDSGSLAYLLSKVPEVTGIKCQLDHQSLLKMNWPDFTTEIGA